MRDRLLHWRIGLLNRLPPHNRGKRIAFIAAAIFMGLVPLLLTETVLRWCQIGTVSDADDPYVGFVNIRPLFVLNPQTERYEIAKNRQTFFRPDSFAATKPANEYRIFCLGGSTVQGRPYAIETSFTTWLEIALQTANPQRQWEVVNCGGVSYASYRLVPILREVLEYQPDLLIICTGHNEFLEDRTYHSVKRTPRWLTRSHAWLSRLHTYNALRSVARSVRGNKPKSASQPLPEEVDALLDYQDGLDDYRRDDAWRDGTIAHFEFNLHHMITLAQQRGVPVMLINPPYNLKDTPPFKYENQENLSDQQRKRFHQLWDEAKQEDRSTDERIDLLEQAIDIDHRHAAVHYHLGRCYLSQGEYEAARKQLLLAKDEDICPLRILSSMREIIAQTARDHDVPLVDAQALFEQLTKDHITGNEWLVDHVHPSMHGHQRLAVAIFDQLAPLAHVEPVAGWSRQRDQAFLEHLQSLDAMYYIRGQQRLEGLRAWTQGRANLIKSRSPQPSP